MLGSINHSGVLIAFFIEDLGAVSLAGGDVSLMEFEALALLRAGVLAGEYYEATNDEGELIGYTMWMPPGREMFSTFVILVRTTKGRHSQTHGPPHTEKNNENADSTNSCPSFPLKPKVTSRRR